MENDLFLRVYLSGFTSGLFADMQATHFKVLVAICTFMDADGKCWPSQEKIAERAGVSKRTVHTAVKALTSYKVDDTPIISTHQEKHGQHTNTVYKVHPVSQIAIFKGGVNEFQSEAEAIGASTLKRLEDRLKEAKKEGEARNAYLLKQLNESPN